MINLFNEKVVYSDDNYVNYSFFRKESSFASVMLLMNAIALFGVAIIQEIYFGGVNGLTIIGILALAFFSVSIAVNLIVMYLMSKDIVVGLEIVEIRNIGGHSYCITLKNDSYFYCFDKDIEENGYEVGDIIHFDTEEVFSC